MAYIDSNTVKEMRNAIKKAYPAFEFSVTTKNSMKVQVCILQGPVDFKEVVTPINAHFNRTENCARAKKMIADIKEIIDIIEPGKEVSFDGDYGSIPSYYVDVQVGKWDKPYIFKGV